MTVITPRYSRTERDRDAQGATIALQPHFIAFECVGRFPLTVATRVRDPLSVLVVRVLKSGDPSQPVVAGAVPQWILSSEPGAIKLNGITGLTEGTRYTVTLRVEGTHTVNVPTASVGRGDGTAQDPAPAFPPSGHGDTHLPNGSDPITTGTPAALTVGGSNVEGSANYFANGLHRHAVASGTPVSLTPGGSNNAGDSGNFVHSNHQHELPPFGTSSGEFAEGDHSHTPESIGAAPGFDPVYRSLQNRKPYAWGNLSKWASDGEGNSVGIGVSGAWHLAPGSVQPVEIGDSPGISSSVTTVLSGGGGAINRRTGGTFFVIFSVESGGEYLMTVHRSSTGEQGTWTDGSSLAIGSDAGGSAPIHDPTLSAFCTDCIVVGDDLILVFDDGSVRMIEDYDTSPSLTVLDDGSSREAIAAIAAGKLEISGTLEDVLMVCCSMSGSDGGWHYAEAPYTSWTQVPFSGVYEDDHSYVCLAYVPEAELWCFGRSDSANSAMRRMFVDGSIDFLTNSTPADILNRWSDLHVVDGANVVIGVGTDGRVMVGRADTTDAQVDWRHVSPTYGDGSADLTSIAFDGRRYLMGQDGYGVYVAHSYDHSRNPIKQRVTHIDETHEINTGNTDSPVIWRRHQKQIGPNQSLFLRAHGVYRADGHDGEGPFLAQYEAFWCWVSARTDDAGDLVPEPDHGDITGDLDWTVTGDELQLKLVEAIDDDVENLWWGFRVDGVMLRYETEPGEEVT